MMRLQHPLLAVKILWTVHHPDGSFNQHTPHLCLRKQYNMSRLLYQFCLFTVFLLCVYQIPE